MAIKTLHTLIKLHKRRIDVLRREMIALEEEQRQLIVLSEKLYAEHAEEIKLVANDARMASFFGAYSKHIKERQEGIAKEVKRLDKAIEAKAEAIQAEFREQKKYEIARTQAEKRLAEENARRLQQRFDEIGAQQYNRLKDTPI